MITTKAKVLQQIKQNSGYGKVWIYTLKKNKFSFVSTIKTNNFLTKKFIWNWLNVIRQKRLQAKTTHSIQPKSARRQTMSEVSVFVTTVVNSSLYQITFCINKWETPNSLVRWGLIRREADFYFLLCSIYAFCMRTIWYWLSEKRCPCPPTLDQWGSNWKGWNF